MTYGVYEVVEGHTYRGHESGEKFEARLDRRAEPMAVKRGVIRLLDTLIPELQPGSYEFPEGWLPGPHHQTTEAREGLFH